MSTTFTVRNGTAVGQESLCRGCRHAHTQTGYADSEEEIWCTYLYPARIVRFAVSQCSDFLDKIAPTLDEMKKVAFLLDVRTSKAIRGFGEATMQVTKPERDDD